MLALANRTGQLEDQEIIATAEKATVTIKRKGRKAHTEVFGREEAAALGLINKDNYKKQPATMFKWRALAANLRVTFPDVISGLYTPEELGAAVNVGEGEEMVVEATAEQPAEEKQAPTVAERIDGAIKAFRRDGWTVEQVGELIAPAKSSDEVLNILIQKWKETHKKQEVA
jgi:DNA-binding transcriptional regulator YhcF (GntR family)